MDNKKIPSHDYQMVHSLAVRMTVRMKVCMLLPISQMHCKLPQIAVYLSLNKRTQLYIQENAIQLFILL